MKNSNILNASKSVYLVGIKGVGMTALAQILQGMGKKVSGSDTHEKFFTDGVLKKLKISFKEGFRASNLPKNTDLVIHSTAFDPKVHPELIATKKKKIPVISYPEAASILFNNSLGIAISGTHGKTTTSALVAESMKNLGFNLTALIGSRVNNWKSNAIVPRRNPGGGEVPTKRKSFFVIEADEHQNKLRFYRPWSIVLTNIDYDHPDFYKKESDYYNAFKNWVAKWKKSKFSLPKIGVFNGDDSKIKRLIRELKLKSTEDCIILTYGKGKNCNFKIQNNLPSVPNLIGQHNAYNLAAAYVFVHTLRWLQNSFQKVFSCSAGCATGRKNFLERILQFDFATASSPHSTHTQEIKKSFKNFTGTERRMQYKGRKGQILVFDDYGHHPKEIKATLSAVKTAYPKHQLFVVFQPHTFTRTAAFLKDFAKSLKIADQIGLLPVYGSARENSGKVSSTDIAKIIGKKNCFYFPTHKDCLEFLSKYKFKKPAILVTMGAGDGWRVGESFLRN